jgi:HprK-related kinase A
MRVGELSLERFSGQLAREGVAIRWGPFVSRIVSNLPELAAPLHFLYSDFPIEPPGGICDFHTQLRGLRRSVLSRAIERVQFVLDDTSLLEPFPRSCAITLLEWGLNACVYRCANHFIMVHAAVVEREGCALVLPGRPGAGKSTLCAALVSAGWRLLSDEVALIDPADGRLRPVARPISLKNHSIEVIRRFAPAMVFGPTTVGTSKGTVAHVKPPSSSVRRLDEAAWPRWIVMPRFVDGAPLQLQSESKAQAFVGLTKNSFNYAVLGETAFIGLVRTVGACACYRLTYGALDDAVATMNTLAQSFPAGELFGATA